MALAELSVPPGPAPSRPVGLARAAERARPVALARTRTLPVPGPLTGLLAEGGLRRGSTVALEGGPGATALGLALGAAASAAGSWLGFVGLPSLGLEAAAELGVVLERVVVVDTPPPGPGDPSSARSRWPTVVATLLEAVDLVYVAVPGRVAGGDARRLVARARERGSVLVRLPADDGRGGHGPPAWPVPADVRFTVAGAEWIGPGGGRRRSPRGPPGRGRGRGPGCGQPGASGDPLAPRSRRRGRDREPLQTELCRRQPAPHVATATKFAGRRPA